LGFYQEAEETEDESERPEAAAMSALKAFGLGELREQCRSLALDSGEGDNVADEQFLNLLTVLLASNGFDCSSVVAPFRAKPEPLKAAA
jgi:hypothetical protein